MKSKIIAALVTAALIFTGAAALGGSVATGQETPEGSTATTPTVPPPTTTEPAPPTADMPLSEFRERRRALLDRVNTIRDRKCRSSVGFRIRTGEIHPLRRAENLSYWRHRVEVNRNRVSKCYPAVMRRKFERMPNYRVQQWYNIHSCEGRWDDAGDPYWGGLQMGRWFMSNYGSDALRYYGAFANRWPPYVQIVVADRAVSDNGAGFGQWPTCAARFGYI